MLNFAFWAAAAATKAEEKRKKIVQFFNSHYLKWEDFSLKTEGSETISMTLCECGNRFVWLLPSSWYNLNRFYVIFKISRCFSLHLNAIFIKAYKIWLFFCDLELGLECRIRSVKVNRKALIFFSLSGEETEKSVNKMWCRKISSKHSILICWDH